jgi:hypothetical protein
VIGIMAAILASLHTETADDPFGTRQRSPRTTSLSQRAFSGRRRSWRRLTAMEREGRGARATGTVDSPHRPELSRLAGATGEAENSDLNSFLQGVNFEKSQRRIHQGTIGRAPRAHAGVPSLMGGLI